MNTRLYLKVTLLGPLVGLAVWPVTAAHATPCSVPSMTYPTIQKAASDATCTEINVAAGLFTEQVSLGKTSVTLRGAGAGRTIIKSPTTRVRSTQTTTYLPRYTYVIEVPPGGTAHITDLTIEGGGNATCAERYFGIRFTSAQGSVERVIVDHVRGSGTSFACANVYGIAATADSGGTSQLTVQASTVRNFQTAGILVSGANATATVENTAVRGVGAQNQQPQTGILFARRGGGSVSRNNLADLTFSGSPCTGLGTALASDTASAVTYTANFIHDADRGIWLNKNNTAQAVLSNRISSTLVGIVSSGNSAGKVNLTGNGIADTARSKAATVATCFNESGDGIAVRTEQKSVVAGNSIAGSARSAVELLADAKNLDVQTNQTVGSGRYDLEDVGTANRVTNNRCKTSAPAGLCVAIP